MISRYMVLVASEQKLLMMRPYQIYAVKHIVDCIDQNCGNGYVWHTTGSGKTLTCFKASTLLKDNADIEKCLFVVDRKDLDRQTREEFNRFQEGCVEENTNTDALVRRLLSDDYADKVIVCTIQKLGLALDENSKRNKQRRRAGSHLQGAARTAARQAHRLHLRRVPPLAVRREPPGHQGVLPQGPALRLHRHADLRGKRHRTSRSKATCRRCRTTEDLFQKQLHAYTITHAIEDGNVLRFHVDYFKPEGQERRPSPAKPLAKRAVVDAILAKHDAATGGRRFNASSPPRHQRRHRVLRPVQARCRPRSRRPTPTSSRSTSPASSPRRPTSAPTCSRFRKTCRRNRKTTSTTPRGRRRRSRPSSPTTTTASAPTTASSEFDLYYQDVQKRIKDQQFPNADLPKKGREKIDITIVVDMLLTGFDCKYLNTLYVDKNLKHHGLIQAFSRTNRVLNATKPYGHILDFRSQQDAVDAAIALFSGAKADQAREIWLVDKAPVVIEKLKAASAEPRRLHEVAGPRQPSPKTSPTSRATTPAPRSSSISRKCSGSRPSSTSTPTSPTSRKQPIEQILPKDEL